jgi:hypothetical protein
MFLDPGREQVDILHHARPRAGGMVGGFSAPGGVVTRLPPLPIEGVQASGPTLFDRLLWSTPRRP